MNVKRGVFSRAAVGSLAFLPSAVDFDVRLCSGSDRPPRERLSVPIRPRAWQTDTMRPLEGLMTAMVTPFRSDGSVNEDGAVVLGRHLLAHGSNGLVVCGTTGESPTLSDDEMVTLVETMVSELGDEALIAAGAGSNATQHACHLAERMAAAGAHALL